MTHVHQPSQIKKYATLGCEKLVFTTAFLSSGIEHVTKEDAIAGLLLEAKEATVQLGLLINRLIMESEWQQFVDEIEKLDLENIKFFVVSDVGVLYYLSTHYSKDIIFFSDTTIANSEDAAMLLNHGAASMMPARELTYDKKYEIAKKYPTQTLLPVFGYQIMSKSYRPLLTNYFKETSQTHTSTHVPYLFKEERRDHYYIGYEDDHGFCMFTDKIVHLFDEKEELESIGLAYGWIDTSFIDETTIEHVIAYYHDQVSKESLDDFLKQTNLDTQLSHGLNRQDTTLVKEKADE